MKRTILAQRLPPLLLGGVLTALLVASAVVVPATPAQAADKYAHDLSISEDLSFKASYREGTVSRLTEEYETNNPEKICKKLRSRLSDGLNDMQNTLKAQSWPVKVGKCTPEGKYFLLEYSGKITVDTLPLLYSTTGPSAIIDGEVLQVVDTFHLGLPIDAKADDMGVMRIRFPGDIKSVKPNLGKVSGNTWTLDKPLKHSPVKNIHITASRHGSHWGILLGIGVPLALIITFTIVILVIRGKKARKQTNTDMHGQGANGFVSPYAIPRSHPDLTGSAHITYSPEAPYPTNSHPHSSARTPTPEPSTAIPSGVSLPVNKPYPPSATSCKSTSITYTDEKAHRA